MNSAEQRGFNSNYPQKILLWKRGDLVPEWLSNRVKIVAIDGNTGSPVPEYRENSWVNGYSLLDSGGVTVAVSVKDSGDYVCFSEETGKLFSLNPKQLNLLYDVG